MTSSGTTGRTLFQNGSGLTFCGLILMRLQPRLRRSSSALLSARARDMCKASPLVSALWVAEMTSQSSAATAARGHEAAKARIPSAALSMLFPGQGTRLATVCFAKAAGRLQADVSAVAWRRGDVMRFLIAVTAVTARGIMLSPGLVRPTAAANARVAEGGPAHLRPTR